ncbi:MAG: hypothetical protein V4760_01315 [Bdellovibrionota bacterium]
MKMTLLAIATIAPLAVQATPLMQLPATCAQLDTQAGKTTSSSYSATIELETRGDGTLTVKVMGPESAYRGAKMVADVRNVELQRSAAGAQAMGTDLETVRLRDRVTKYEVFTSARVNKSLVRLVRMTQYDDAGVWPKRSSKRVVECTLGAAVGSNDIAKLVEAVNANR